MLRKGQKELVELYRKGYCAIPAIPGGGKTYALTQWAVKIISEGLQGKGKVLIVTYMNSAAKNFKRRIGEELNKLGINTMMFTGDRSDKFIAQKIIVFQVS